MQNIINSFKAHLYERTSSPLIGSFIFYWIICNYKLVIVLFSSYEPTEMFQIIKNLYPQEKITLWTGFDIHYYSLLGNGLLMPLLIALAYIFIIPYPSKLIYSFWKNRQKELLKIKYKIEDETPIGEEQARKLRSTLYELQKKYDSQFEEVTNLKSLINSTDELPNIITHIEDNIPDNLSTITPLNIPDNNQNSNYTINFEESKILEKVGNSLECKINDIVNIPKDKIEFDHYIDVLTSNELIKINNDNYITLTKKGRESLMNFRNSKVYYDNDEIPF